MEDIFSEPFIIQPNEIYLTIISTESREDSNVDYYDAMFQYIQRDDKSNCYFLLQGFHNYTDDEGKFKAHILIFHI